MLMLSWENFEKEKEGRKEVERSGHGTAATSRSHPCSVMVFFFLPTPTIYQHLYNLRF